MATYLLTNLSCIVIFFIGPFGLNEAFSFNL